MSEEKLRDALDWLVHLHHGVSKAGQDPETGAYYPVTDEEWKAALEEAKQALSEAGEPEMVRLRIQLDKWLKDAGRFREWDGYDHVIDYIEYEFGVTLPEGEK